MKHLILLFVLCVIGCGGSGTNNPSSFAGNWEGTGLQIQVDPDGSFDGFFIGIPGSSISGTMSSNHTIEGTWQKPSEPEHSFEGGWSTISGGQFLNWVVSVDGGSDETFAFERP